MTQNTVRGSVPDISSMVALVAQHTSESRAPSQPLCAFLSFATKDKVLVDGIRNELELQQPSIELLDHAAQENYEADWKHDCARKIHRSAVLICLVGTSTHESEAWAALGEGRDPKSYKPFTYTEALVSNIFMVIYGLAALLTVAWLIRSYL